MDVVRLLYQPWTTRVARRVLSGRLRARTEAERGRFTRGDVDRLLMEAWRRYEGGAPTLAKQPTAGSTMNVHLACFTFSFFEALLAEGVEREYAIELIADAAWGVYSFWGAWHRASLDSRREKLQRSASPKAEVAVGCGSRSTHRATSSSPCAPSAALPSTSCGALWPATFASTARSISAPPRGAISTTRSAR